MKNYAALIAETLFDSNWDWIPSQNAKAINLYFTRGSRAIAATGRCQTQGLDASANRIAARRGSHKCCLKKILPTIPLP